jgi:16S rRNA (cytosine1402-N4)-methyltransferase
LARIVRAAAGGRRSGSRIDPATRTFMALRIAVNEELSGLETLLPSVPAVLRPGARLCVLTFHSLEDRIVKRALRQFGRSCVCPPLAPRCTCQARPAMRSLTRRAVKPSAAEIDLNPMARSAKLRVAERL